MSLLPASLAVLLWVGLLGPAAADPGAPEPRPVADLLLELEQEGVRLIWSERLVSSDLESVPPPVTREVGARLAEILGPHGLEAVAAAGGRWVVRRVRKADRPPPPPPASPPDGAAEPVGPVTVTIRVVRADGTSVAGALAWIGSDGRELRADEDGRFEVELPPDGLEVVVSAPGFSPSRLRVSRESAAVDELEVELREASVAERFGDDVTVTGSWSLYPDATAASGLDADWIEALPHFGDDLLRLVSALPGTATGDFSSRFSVRGGEPEDVLVQLDGQELFAPFHLEDLEGLFSIVDPEAVAAMDLLPGGFPVDSGDRMGAVLDLTTRRPAAGRVSLGISFSNAWLGGAGTFAGERGSWLASLRRGYLDVVLGLVEGSNEIEDGEEVPDPRYWDLLVKGTWSHGPAAETSIHGLASGDRLRFEEREEIDELARVRTGYDSRAVWLRHHRGVGRRALLRSLASVTRLENFRDASSLDDGEEEFRIDDRRSADVANLRQDVELLLSSHLDLRVGTEARRQEATYRIHSRYDLPDPIDDPRFEAGAGAVAFDADPVRDQLAAWSALRVRRGRTTAEAGLRWDRQSDPDETQWSPRLHVVRELGAAGRIRAAWGLFHQSERAHEIAAEFGETTLRRAQEAEHWTLGWDRDLGARARLRIDLYRREVADPAPRWETVFDPFRPFPELAIDRVLVRPEHSLAEGVELDLRGRWSRRVEGWLTVAASTTEDRIAGRTVPRAWDQPLAAQAGIGWRPGPRWSLTAVWTWHEGWPTTAVEASWSLDADGEPVIAYRVGPIYGERLADYHRLDVRVARSWTPGRGRLTAFLDVQNLADRENPRGVAITDPVLLSSPEGRGEVAFPENHWLPILPSFGISWAR